MVVFSRPLLNVGVPRRFHFGDMIRYAPKHLFDRFSRLAVVSAADVTLHQHLPCVIGQIRLG